MVQRRRYATRDELVELLLRPSTAPPMRRHESGKAVLVTEPPDPLAGIDHATAERIIDRLVDLGVPIESLVRITVDEPLP